MWKFTAKYEDWNGNQKERVLRFNLTETELTKLQFSKDGGIDRYYEHLMETNDMPKLYATFEELVHLSYGEISEDGERFMKNEEVYNRFKESLAYDAFMTYITTTEDGAAKFITGILPKSYRNALNSPEGKKIASERGINISSIQ